MRLLLSNLTELEKSLETEEKVEKIIQFIQASPNIKTVASYAAMPFELNLDALNSALPEVRFCYPKCGKNGNMEFHAVRELSEMKTSDYGIREPDDALHQRVDPGDIDLFLCPAYAYQCSGERLGKGGGFYDRYLRHKRPDTITLGIVFSSQIIAHIPIEPHDLLVDRVL